MSKRYVKPEDMEREIVRLEKSSYVKLAKTYETVEHVRREYLAELQRLEAKGMDLASAGISLNMLSAILGDEEFH